MGKVMSGLQTKDGSGEDWSLERRNSQEAMRGRPKTENSGDVGAWKAGCVVLTAIKLARISSPVMVSPNGHSHLTRVP